MFNWLFKKVVTFREKVAVDLGQGDDEKPFLDHLDDLRTMIVRMAVTLLVMTLVTFFFIEELMAIMTYPLVLAGINDKVTLQNIDPTGGFVTAMNVALVASVILAFPVLLYFLLQFVLPGLRNNEKKVLFPALGVGGGLFLMGVLFAYFVVSPRALTFFYEFSRDMGAVSKPKQEQVQTEKPEKTDTTTATPTTTTTLPDLKPGTRITATTAEGKSFVFEVVEVHAPPTPQGKEGTSTPNAEGEPVAAAAAVAAPASAPPAAVVAVAATPFIWELKQYVKFVCQFILIFGACFELPVVVMALVKLDVLNYKVMKTSRSWAAIIICVAAALITPTQDAMTLGLLAVPMYILYEICIWLAWWLEKRDRALYPEYYKEQDEDAKALEVSDDWDNENYNPWGGGDEGDEDDDDSGSKPKPKPSPAPSSVGEAKPVAEAPASEDPVSDSSYSPPESGVTSPAESDADKEKADADVPTDQGAKEPDKTDNEPTADKRDTD